MARGSEGNRERGRPGVNALFSSNPQEEGGGDQENHLANVFSLAANEEEDWKEHQAVRTEEGFKSGVNQGLTPAFSGIISYCTGECFCGIYGSSSE